MSTHCTRKRENVNEINEKQDRVMAKTTTSTVKKTSREFQVNDMALIRALVWSENKRKAESMRLSRVNKGKC